MNEYMYGCEESGLEPPIEEIIFPDAEKPEPVFTGVMKVEASDFVTEFLAGQMACQKGEECPPGSSKDFERGYSAQYQHEQNMTELSREQS